MKKNKKRVAHNKGVPMTPEQKEIARQKSLAYYASDAYVLVKEERRLKRIEMLNSPKGIELRKQHSKRMKGNTNGSSEFRKSDHNKPAYNNYEHNKGENNPMYGKHHKKKSKDAISEKRKGIEPYNKGLTKLTDPRVAKNAESTSKGMQEYFDSPKGKKRKKEISKEKIEYFKENDSYWKGKNLPKEMCEQISETLTGRIPTKEQLENLSKAMSGKKKSKDHKNNIGISVRKHYASPAGEITKQIIGKKVSDYLKTEKGIQQLKDHKKYKTKPSCLEVIVGNFLDRMKIDFDRQFYIYHTKLKKLKWFDFYLPDYNMLIEVDGKYWHQEKERINNDKIKTKLALDSGFLFLRISEEDINSKKYKAIIYRAVNQDFKDVDTSYLFQKPNNNINYINQ